MCFKPAKSGPCGGCCGSERGEPRFGAEDMNAALELIQMVEANGGQFRIDGEDLLVAPKDAGERLVDELLRHKSEIIDLLQKRQNLTSSNQQDDDWNLWLQQ